LAGFLPGHRDLSKKSVNRVGVDFLTRKQAMHLGENYEFETDIPAKAGAGALKPTARPKSIAKRNA
jgi:hypothetical protein